MGSHPPAWEGGCPANVLGLCATADARGRLRLVALLRRSRRQLERLELEELFQPEFAELTAVTRLLVATERRQRIEGAAVDLHLPGADAQRDLLSMLRAAPPDTACQPVHAVVR